LKIIEIITYGDNVSKLQKTPPKKYTCNRSYINNSTGQSFEPDKLNLIGKCAIPLAKSAVEKRLLDQSLSDFLRMLLIV